MLKRVLVALFGVCLGGSAQASVIASGVSFSNVPWSYTLDFDAAQHPVTLQVAHAEAVPLTPVPADIELATDPDGLTGLSGGSVQTSAMPEAWSIVLLGSGLLALGVFKSRMSRRK